VLPRKAESEMTEKRPKKRFVGIWPNAQMVEIGRTQCNRWAKKGLQNRVQVLIFFKKSYDFLKIKLFKYFPKYCSNFQFSVI
jgi:hypothetical protein